MWDSKDPIRSSDRKTVGAEEWHQELLLSALIRSSIRMQNILDRSFSEFGVTAQEAAVLVRCVEAGETSASKLAVAIGRDKGKITRFVDRLLAKNLITREVNVRDRRLYVLKATSRGRRIAPRLSKVFGCCRSKFLVGISAEDIRQVATVLTRIDSNGSQFYPNIPTCEQAKDGFGCASKGPVKCTPEAE